MYRILYNMKAITYTEARAKLAATIKQVCEDHAPVIVTKRRDVAVVMLSLEDYSSDGPDTGEQMAGSRGSWHAGAARRGGGEKQRGRLSPAPLDSGSRRAVTSSRP